MTTQLVWESRGQLPSLMGAYARALGKRISADALAQPWPELMARALDVPLPLGRARAYEACCGWPSAQALAPLAPHLMAAPLHAQLLAHPSQPLSLAGLIHVRNVSEHLAPILGAQTLTLEAHQRRPRPHAQGALVDLVTQAWVSGQAEPCWRETTTILARGLFLDEDAHDPLAHDPLATRDASPKATRRPGSGRRGRGTAREAARSPGDRQAPSGHELDAASAAADLSTSWRLSADLGRRYGMICGDLNPIHLSAPSARLFGFKRAIIHGMWTASRALSDLSDALPQGRWQLTVEFKRPLALPSSVVHTSWLEPDAQGRLDAGRRRLEVRSADLKTLHMSGLIERLEDAASLT